MSLIIIKSSLTLHTFLSVVFPHIGEGKWANEQVSAFQWLRLQLYWATQIVEKYINCDVLPWFHCDCDQWPVISPHYYEWSWCSVNSRLGWTSSTDRGWKVFGSIIIQTKKRIQEYQNLQSVLTSYMKEMLEKFKNLFFIKGRKILEVKANTEHFTWNYYW